MTDMLTAALLRHLHDRGVVEFDEAGLTGNSFVETYPNSPDLILVARSTGGLESDGHTGYDRPTFQLYARSGPDPRDARNLLAAAYDELEALHGVRLPSPTSDPQDGIWTVSIRAVQTGPVWIGRDANQRAQYTQNFLAETRNATANRV